MSEKITKLKVADEWLRSVPELSPFNQHKLYRVAGCFLMGLELIKLPHSDDYRPHFVIYALWKDGFKKCLDAPVLMKQIYNRKGLQLTIPYENSANFLNDAIECLKLQVPILFDKNVSLHSLFELIESSFDDVLIKTNSAQQAKLFELKFYSALYIGSNSQIQNILLEIQQGSKNWNLQMFEMWNGKFDNWLKGLQDKIDSREDFLNQITTNKQDAKISRLKHCELLA